jgi:uncharacterized protein YndB with AHSA1/START domain
MHRIDHTVVIAAPLSAVWQALLDPAAMAAWMGDADMHVRVETDWRVGAAIVISGVHHGPFRNTGTVLDVRPGQALRYSHLSSVSNLPDHPDHYSVIGFDLAALDNRTTVRLTVERFATDVIFKHLDLYWRGTLAALKAYVEQDPR